jgi:light-regulated signal transduction histidine kinase (bacteriophytochrome)
LEIALKHQITETGIYIHYNNLPIVTGQPVLISLLLQSLIENAIKFRSQDRNLVIFIRHYLVDGINLNNSEIVVNSKFTVLSVIDNGIGFESQHARNMFSPFFQLHGHGKYKGSVMALPLCKKIMEIHQGYITAKCSNYNGSTFNCFFPSQIIRSITVTAIEK